MFRTVVRLSPSFSIPIFQDIRKYDEVIKNNAKKDETGWDRVKKMYTKSEFEEISVELTSVVQTATTGAFLGACIGGFVTSRVAYINFIENNQASIFKTTADAQKKLQDYVTIAFAKGAYRWGWRLGFFTGTFSLIATTVSVYYGDTTMLEYVLAGAITGAIYKVNLGLAATIVGGCLGAALSTVAGLIIIGLLKLTGITMEEIRKALYSVKTAREDQFNQALEKSATIKNDALTDNHKYIVSQLGEKKIEEIN